MKFELIEKKLSWIDAVNFAQSRGGKLISLDSMEYEFELIKFLEDKNVSQTSLWTSGKKSVFGDFEWTEKEDSFFDYKNFGQNSEFGNCITFNSEIKIWDSESCENKNWFIVGYDNNKIGESNIEFSKDGKKLQVEFSKPYSDLRPKHEIILKYKE